MKESAYTLLPKRGTIQNNFLRAKPQNDHISSAKCTSHLEFHTFQRQYVCSICEECNSSIAFVSGMNGPQVCQHTKRFPNLTFNFKNILNKSHIELWECILKFHGSEISYNTEWREIQERQFPERFPNLPALFVNSELWEHFQLISQTMCFQISQDTGSGPPPLEHNSGSAPVLPTSTTNL